MYIYYGCLFTRLCGCMPFNGDTAAHLEESIMSGHIKFKEPEWISIADQGALLHVYNTYPSLSVCVCNYPYIARGMIVYVFHNYPAKELIEGMLHLDTVKRFTARQVLEDPWITVSHAAIELHMYYNNYV